MIMSWFKRNRDCGGAGDAGGGQKLYRP